MRGYMHLWILGLGGAAMSETEETKESAVQHTLQRAKDSLSGRLVELAHKESVQQETVYNVVFTGKFLLPEAIAIASLAKFFKQGKESTKRLLKPGMVLKSYSDKGPADKLNKLLRQMGAECRVQLETIGDEQEPSMLERVAFKLEDMKIPKVHAPNPKQWSKQKIGIFAGALVLLLGLVLYGVFRPLTITGESLAEYQASIAKMLSTVDPSQRDKLERAIDVLTRDRLIDVEQNPNDLNKASGANFVYAPIKDKSASKILAEAEAKLEKQRVFYRNAISETEVIVASLEQELKNLQSKNVQLKKIQTKSERFSWKPGKSPSLSFRLTNNTDKELLRVLFEGELYDRQGRLLLNNPFSYMVTMGILPKRSANVYIPSRSDGVWASDKIKNKGDLTLKVIVANAEDRSGNFLGVDYRPIRDKLNKQNAYLNKLRDKLQTFQL